MNELKNLEARLGGWTPRRPSRRIESTIFDRQPVESNRPAESATAAGWFDRLVVCGRLLGPVGTFALVMLVSLSSPTGRTDGVSAGAARYAMAGGRPAPAFDQLYHHSVLNHCDYPIFGWTNLALPGDGIALFAVGQRPCSD